MSDDIRFSTMEVDDKGNLREVEVKMLSRQVIMNCPAYILLASHYRDDGTCRCDQKTCEWQDCGKPKYDGEIYCFGHMEELGY